MQTSLAICFSEGVNNTGYLICQKNYRQKSCHRPESQACPEICLLAKLIYRFIDWKNYIIPCINLVKNMCNEKRYTKLTSQRQSPFIQAMYKQLKKSCLVKWDFLWISYKEPLSPNFHVLNTLTFLWPSPVLISSPLYKGKDSLSTWKSIWKFSSPQRWGLIANSEN